jgi:predicted DNA-binding transcriptional regulator AlpA
MGWLHGWLQERRARGCKPDGGGVLSPVTLAALADALERAAAALREVAPSTPPAAAPPCEPSTWRERVWTCDPATRLGVTELAEALGRPKSWVYRHTSAHTDGPRLPCRKLGGELTFLASEIRAWVAASEVVIAPGRTAPLVVERRPRGAA